MGRPNSATRMELLRLRRRLSLARRGHHLLKGKQDELLRRFLGLLEAYLRERHALHGLMAALARKTGEVRTELSADSVRVASWPPPPEATVTEGSSHILSLRVPRYDLHQPGGGEGAYGLSQLPASYDELAALWREAGPRMIDVGAREKVLLELAAEIERTRRRVNALEHNLIPGIEEGIRTITFRLAEHELGTLTRLMRIKDIVRGR